MAGKIRPIKAMHEASHAVMARILGIELAFVTVRPTSSENAGAARTYTASWLARNLDTSVQALAAEKDCMVSLAAMAGRKRSDPSLLIMPDDDDATYDAEFGLDIKKARYMAGRAARLMAGEPVADDEPAVKFTDVSFKDAKARYGKLWARTCALVAEHWNAIERVKKALENNDRIDQREVDRLIALVERHAAH